MNPAKYEHRIFLVRFRLWGHVVVPSSYLFTRRGIEPQCWTCDKSAPLYICRLCALRKAAAKQQYYLIHDCTDYIMCIPCLKDKYEGVMIAAALSL